MDPSQVLASLRQGVKSDERPMNHRGIRGRSGQGPQSRTPLSHVHHQAHHGQQPRPVPDYRDAFYDLIKKNNLPTPKFHTLNAATKREKIPQFVSKVTVGEKSWKTHPKTFPTAEEAVKGAVTIAYQDLCAGVGNLSVFPEGGQVSDQDLLQRVLEIVKNEPAGMIDTAIVEEYIKRYKCNVPKNWIEILSSNSDQITLTHFEVHNKTVYTILPTKPVGNGGKLLGNGGKLLGNGRSPTVTKESTTQGVSPSSSHPTPESAVTSGAIGATVSQLTSQPNPQPTTRLTNGAKVNASMNGKDEEIDFESNGDMLATLAIIPPAIPPPVSVNPGVDGSYFDVYCTLAASPHHFWVQPYDNVQGSGVFVSLCDAMKVFYDNEENHLPIHGSPVKKGVAFATKLPDKLWYRVIVDSIVPDSDPAEVVCSFVDCGEIRVIKVEDLQPLYSQFQKLPRQAMKASLSNVAALNGDWSVEATIEFKQMVESKAFVSVVKGVEGSGTQILLQLQLIDTTGTDDLDVGKILVDKNMAILK